MRVPVEPRPRAIRRPKALNEHKKIFFAVHAPPPSPSFFLCLFSLSIAPLGKFSEASAASASAAVFSFLFPFPPANFCMHVYEAKGGVERKGTLWTSSGEGGKGKLQLAHFLDLFLISYTRSAMQFFSCLRNSTEDMQKKTLWKK